MRTVLFLVEKEFRQIFRNRILLAIIMLVPLVQLVILPLTADYEVKNLRLSVVNLDPSSGARGLISKIAASGYFRLVSVEQTYDDALALVEADRADLLLVIPAHFEANLVREKQDKLFVAANAINGVKAGLGTAYLNSIIRDYNEGLRRTWGAGTPEAISLIEVRSANWYNPYMNYRLFMVPGILAILVSMVGGYMAALNIVKEKEAGTIEQINVSPIRKHHFIIGKLVPFWIMGLVVFTLGMTVGWAVYGVTPVGSLALLYLFLAIYLMAMLGIGLLISTYTESQQQAMLVSFFFVMIFILMSGLFTSIDSMPGWARIVARINPVTYFIEVMRLVVLKGSGLRHILPHLGVVVLFTLVFNVWAVLNYRKTLP